MYCWRERQINEQRNCWPFVNWVSILTYFFNFFCRLLKDSKLSVLILAGNTDIEAAITESLLLAAKDSKTLQRLNLSACGIKSPLDTTFFHSLRTVASNSDGCLKEVNMSYNNLSVEDKQTLEEDWQSCSSGESSVCLENSLCVFTK